MDARGAGVLEAELAAARHALRERQPAVAQRHYARILAIDPDHLEALSETGLHALASGAPHDAIPKLARVIDIDAANPHALLNLGLAYRAAGQPIDACSVLEQAIRIDPEFSAARLHLGAALEDCDDPRAALIQYFAAVTRAQARGRWLGPETTAPALRDLVLHAMDAIDAGRRQLFVAALEPLRHKYGEPALARVMPCLDGYLGLAPVHYPDPRQIPKFLFFPGLPATPFFDRDLFPWYAQLESHVEIITEELQAVLDGAQGIEPFLKIDSPEQAAGYLAGGDAAPVWDAFFFYRHGVRNDANCARCPRTAAIIDALPLVRIREHAPEICFSLLTPGTHILPHRGVTNTRLVTHLPLIVPENCALVVGGERREWKPGECFTFDDTFEHEAWNRGSSLRVVMLMDCWNPHLTAVEREAVAVLVEAIGDFHREAGVPSD